MSNKENVIAQIKEAFGGNESPGDPYLQPYPVGHNLSDEIKAFKGIQHWQDASSSLLDNNPDALSFFSETGFRLFLPAYLIADMNNKLECVEPLFHLVFGFSEKYVNLPVGDKDYNKLIGKSEFVNPIQYGAVTWLERYRFRLSIFPREEAGAIVSYLEYMKAEENSDEVDREEIDAALDLFWLERANNAPLKIEFEKHIKLEQDFVEHSLKSLRDNNED